MCGVPLNAKCIVKQTFGARTENTSFIYLCVLSFMSQLSDFFLTLSPIKTTFDDLPCTHNNKY